jgi:hypothetical protein
LIRDVAALFAHDNFELSPFCLVADEGTGVALLLHGDMDARIAARGDSIEEISGRESMTWVDRVVGEDFVEVVVGSPSRDATNLPFDLRDGVVPGAGITLIARGDASHESNESRTHDIAAPAPPREPEPAPPREPEPAAPREPEPPPEPEPEPAPEPAPEADVVFVQGVTCNRGHFNRPDVSYCSVCGTSMIHQTHQPVQGPRPPLGILVLGDGTVVGLDRDVVIGREPGEHDDVVAGLAKPVVVDDPELTVSRAHAVVRLDGWDVKVVDCGSQNGTEIIPPNAHDAMFLEPGEATKIVPGSKIVLGRYTVSFNSSLH